MKEWNKETKTDPDRFKPSLDPHLTLRRKMFNLTTIGVGDDNQFELGFMESVLRQDPCNEDALMTLGHAYTRLGHYEKGLDIDRRLVRLRPSDPTAFYNLACSCALLGKIDEAFVALDRAIALGYRDAEYMMGDPDLAALREAPRFVRLLNRIKGETASES